MHVKIFTKKKSLEQFKENLILITCDVFASANVVVFFFLKGNCVLTILCMLPELEIPLPLSSPELFIFLET